MSSDINYTVQIGRLTRDAGLEYTNRGTAVCNFSIAVNDTYTSGGQKTEYVSYFEVNLWGKVAEALAPYLVKGKQVAITGKLKQERWKEQNGNNRSKIKINCQALQLLGSKTQGDQQQNNAPHTQQSFEDDIPF